MSNAKEIIIHQPSKVGSTTVFVHLMNHYGLERNQVITCPNNNGRYPVDVSHRIYHAHHERTLPKKLNSKIQETDEIVYFISMTRDPVARNLSSFFEMPHYKGVLNTGDVDTIKNSFIKNYDHYRGMKWYDHQIKDWLGIDIHIDDFDVNKGYKIYQNDNKRLLFIRSEDITEKFNEGVSKLLGEEITSDIQNKNVTLNKYSLYDEVKNTLKLPIGFLDELYGTDHIKHFYSDDEITKMKNRWLN